MKLVWPSAKLLQAAAGASLRAYHRVTGSVLPLLLEQYTKYPQVRGTPGSAVTGGRAERTRWLCRAWWEQGVRLGVLPGCRWGPRGHPLALQCWAEV